MNDKRRLNIPASLVHRMRGKLYKLNGKILSLDESTETAKMSFITESGKTIIKSNIPFKNIDINEGFLDTLKQYGHQGIQAIGNAAKSVATAFKMVLKRIGGWLQIGLGEEIVEVSNSPINMCIAQSRGMIGESVSITPSASMIDTLRKNGIRHKPISNVFFEADDETLEEINKFWSERIKFIANDNSGRSVRESLRYYNAQQKELNEAIASLKANKFSKIKDVNTEELMSLIYDSIDSQLCNLPGENKAEGTVLLIWGAPGIGKTAIVRQVNKLIEKRSGDRLAITNLNCAIMKSDEYTLPMIDVDRAGVKKVENATQYWLPVYKLDDTEQTYELPNGKTRTMTITQIKDYYYNTGKLPGEVIDADKQHFGGILFFDEFSRANTSAKNGLMKLVLEREFGDAVLASGWAMIAAANRKTDMSEDLQRSFTWEAANQTRFQQVNYVPTKAEWLKWATAINERTGEPNVHISITSFLEQADDGVWYDALDLGSRRDIKDETGKPLVNANDIEGADEEEINAILEDPKIKGIMTSWNPRTWTNASDALYAKERKLMGTDYDKELADKIAADPDLAREIPAKLRRKAIPADEDELIARYAKFYNENKILDPSGNLKERTDANVRTMLKRWFTEVILPTYNGFDNITTSEFKKYTDFLSVFDSRQLNSIWNTGACTFAEDRNKGNNKYYESIDALKWKTNMHLQEEVLKLVLGSYPGGETGLRRDAQDAVRKANEFVEKPLADTILSPEEFSKVINDVFTLKMNEVNTEGEKTGDLNIVLLLDAQQFGKDPNGNPIELSFADRMYNSDPDGDQYISMRNLANKGQRVIDILKYNPFEHSNDNNQDVERITRQQNIISSFYSKNNIMRLALDGDPFVLHMINLAKFIAMISIQSEANKIQGVAIKTVIGNISKQVNAETGVEELSKKHKFLNELNNGWLGKAFGEDLVKEAYKNKFCNIPMEIVGIFNTANDIISDMSKNYKQYFRKNDLEDEEMLDMNNENDVDVSSTTPAKRRGRPKKNP